MAISAREKMIEAAERIAGTRGLAAMSLREVQAAAGQRNKSAAQYHFGSRDGLVEAVLTSRMALVAERRQELLDRLDAQGDGPGAPVTALVDALIRPIAEHAAARADSHWARFVLQCAADPGAGDVIARSTEGRTYRDAVTRLDAALADVPADRRRRRIEHALGFAFLALAHAEAARDDGRPPALPIETQIAELVAMCTGLLAAPMPAPVTA